MGYSQSDMAEFANRARNHVLGFVDDDGNDETRDEEYTTRGYERYDIGRAKRKLAVRKIVLLAHAQKTLTLEEKASIARKASSSAVDDAIATGCRDYLVAHHDHRQSDALKAFDALLADANSTAMDKAAAMFVISNKRVYSCCDNSNDGNIRNVRQRTV